MSDQYTRITCGGSPLDTNAPVVGLLFGESTIEAGGSSLPLLRILDADDIPTDTSEASKIQVELHRAVFPQHSVVGWYRVSKQDDEPTPNDLQLTQQLQQHYYQSTLDSTATTNTTTTTVTTSFVFCLLQVHQPAAAAAAAAPSDVAKDDSPISPAQELPITLYELHTVGDRTILLGLNQWQLQTSEPERIAVERVMREKPITETQKSPYVTHVQSLQHSLLSMKDRIQVLLQYLRETQSGKVPMNYSLLRDVQGLVYSLGPLAAASAASSSDNLPSSDDAILLSHLAAIAKTTSAVQAYTDKFRLVHESRTVGKEMRGHAAF